VACRFPQNANLLEGWLLKLPWRGHYSQYCRVRAPEMCNKLTIAILLLITVLVCAGSPAPACRPEGKVVREAGQDCRFGTGKDWCGRTSCLRGPGEVCGGQYNVYGACSEGLFCSNCNRCSGCSFVSFTCWDGPCFQR